MQVKAPRGRSGRRAVSILGALVVAAGLAVSPPVARTVAAAEDLRLGVEATYTLDPAAGRVRVVLDIAATNVKPNTATAIYYFQSLFFGVQPEASGIRASDATGALGTTLRTRSNHIEVSVDLRSRLYHRQTARLRIRYDLPGGEPRSESWIRVGDAFATFGVWAWGDPGRSRVEVRIPAGFELDVRGSPMAQLAEPDGIRLQAMPTDPASFYAVIDAENEAAYERRRLSLGGSIELVILAWPEDEAWQATVATTLEAGVPVLLELIGLDWPVRHDLEVRQRFTPALEGYAGVFYRDESIDVGEDLDPLVIIHEASHAWFNDKLFTGRWIAEGLAQEYSWRVLSRTGGGPPVGLPSRPNPDDPGAVALTTWSHPGVIRDQETDDAERFGYEASWWVVHRIVTVAGEERMRRAFAAAQANSVAYLGAGSPESHFGPDGFARFYDLVEDIGSPDSPDLEEAFRTVVLSSAQASLLDARREARAAYRRLLEAGQGWLPPWYVRRPMGDWQFATAIDRIDEAIAVLDQRDRVAAEAEALALRPDDALRSEYEAAKGGMEAALAIADRQLDALEAIDEARLAIAAERDLFVTVGLLDAAPDISYAEARAAFAAGDLERAAEVAATAAAVIAGAAGIGQGRVAVAIVAVAVGLLLLLLVVALFVRRRARRAGIPLGVAMPVGAGAYATLAADPDAPRVEDPEAALEGGEGEGGRAIEP